MYSSTHGKSSSCLGQLPKLTLMQVSGKEAFDGEGVLLGELSE